MTDVNQDLNARLRAFFATAAAPPVPSGLEDRIVARLGRVRSPFLPRSRRVTATTVDHPVSSPSDRVARFGAAAAALATAVALGAVGLASHHTLIGSGGAGATGPLSMTATASPADLSGARAAAAAFFDPSLPQCWREPAVKGQPWPADSFVGCPVTSRLGNQLRDYAGLYMDGSILTEYRTPSLRAGLSSPSPSPAGQQPQYLVTVGQPVATSAGATVKVLASDAGASYENDAIVVHTSTGWRIDDILIYGHNMPLPSRDPRAPGEYFVPDASGFPVSLYNPCTVWTAAAPPLRGC